MNTLSGEDSKMQLSPENTALVKIAEMRNAAIKERDANEGGGHEWHFERGKVAGLTHALELLREAGMPVASAEYLAVRQDA